MSSIRTMPRRLLLALLAVLLIGGATSAVVVTRGPDRERAEACGGRAGGEEAEERERERAQGERERGERAAPAADLFTGPGEIESPCGEAIGKPESFADLAKANSGIVTKSVAPGTRIRTGAYRAAIGQRAALPVVGTTWKRYGTPPLQSYRTDYDTETGSTREGLGDLSGRATAITRSQGTLYAAISNGGIWKSADDGNSWTSVGEKLPTQVVSGVAVSGERLLVLTGDNAFGGNTYAGLGAYFSDDGGATWKHAAGIPDGLLSFRLAVDPNDEKTVYAATGGGLFRSTDGGRSYTNVNLPTGKDAPAGTPDCTGQPTTAKDCFLANVVTDVVVQAPANEQSSGGKPGAVMAAVGWRAGTKPNADGAQQSPGNGIYVSDDGAPGSFTNADFAGHSTPATDPLTQARIGRIALGGATGADQDHRIVYALVQDAVKFNGGIVGLDANENDTTSAVQSDYLNGVWVSTDFGQSWKQLEGSTVIDNDPTSNSALSPPVCKAPAVISYCPGIQAWYNLWIAPDPSRQTSAGVPTRLAFGLEEVWSNTGPLESPTGLDGTVPEKFGVVGRYYAGETCTLLNATNGLPICPVAQGGQVPAFTTHPDQHGALWVPDASGGGVTLFAGNDGGIYRQSTDAAGALSNDNWGTGVNVGLNTLQPYDVALANDGTAYMGLQDNGEAKVDPDGRGYTVFGGDGFFTAVDPADPNVAYEEYVGGAVSGTKDGGKTWSSLDPTLINPAFSTPLEMDPADANHLVIAGCDVRETTAGPSTAPGTGSGDTNWRDVFELGTQAKPGSTCPTSPLPADPTASDIVNEASAVDVRSQPAPVNAATGPRTADFSYSAGATTIPGPTTQAGTFLPGTYDDHPFTIQPDEGDASFTVDVTWGQPVYDWDLYVYKKTGSTLTEVGSSATSQPEEKTTIVNPTPGDYVIRVVNFTAFGTFDAKVTFEQRTSAAQTTAAGAPSFAYVGFCGFCDTITQGTPFANGIATDVGGDKPGKGGSSDGWHVVKAAGLPNRLISSIRMDPSDPKTVYVTLAGYGRKWAAPGAVGEDTSKVG
ncbi:MAG: hypothetical protein QOI80_693, partial [Solirubrobacteraceae bacterium]|nr:hypothetical protein [Solirubrobacteraceae bacterium]